MKFKYLLIVLVFISEIIGNSQDNLKNETQDFQQLKWRWVAANMPAEWYDSKDARFVAENLLICQREIGGWCKNIPYHHSLTELEKKEYLNNKSEIGATFDNGATITELLFLAKVYTHFPDERYRKSFEKGLNYIFISQYENGGWPQFYPVKNAKEEFLNDKTIPYSAHITYNDHAILNIMRFLQGIISNSPEFSSLKISDKNKAKAEKAYQNGIQCILKTQIVIDDKPTVWCAQHDEKTLSPANARSYELASFSGSESAGITLFLMSINNPSETIISSVKGAAKWFEDHNIEGIKIIDTLNSDGKKDRIVSNDPNAPELWARFYDLETGKPFFSDRDGIKKSSLAEIDIERRIGYGWYTTLPSDVLSKYPEWLKKISININTNEN